MVKNDANESEVRPRVICLKNVDAYHINYLLLFVLLTRARCLELFGFTNNLGNVRKALSLKE